MPAGQRGPLSTRGTSEVGGGVLCKIFCLMCEVSRKNPSVTCGASSPFRGAYIPKGEPECKKPPLKGEGDRRRRWRGSCGIFYVMCKVLRKYPSVTCGASSPFRGAYIPKGEPECKKPPLKGEGDRRRRWRGSVWNLLLGVKGLRDNPSVKPAACQLPFQGSLYTKREPECKKPPLKGEGDQRSWWRGSL